MMEKDKIEHIELIEENDLLVYYPELIAEISLNRINTFNLFNEERGIGLGE